jgi:arylsulfatase A-like enzyme
MEFGGKIGDDWRTSEPWWPPVPTPPDGAPNIVLIVLDDVGFAQLGCYGSDIETPVIDGLAAKGVRLTNFHTTALCSPTRACLLTGRNHHRSGMGRVADLASGFPGYWGRPPRENGFLSEILQAHGYATYAVGKWHLSPEDETNMAKSRATWPLGRGFDRWYGFHGGETHQFTPGLYHDNHSVRPPRSIEEGYHLSADLADRAIEFLGDLRAVDDALPFFLYFATGACHSPHHAPADWIEKYRGHFAQGWDRWRDETFARQLAMRIVPEGTVLSPRPPWVPAWDDLDEREQTLSQRFMECFAAFLSYTDQQVGRLLDFIEDLGDADNTAVILVSDNGASSEGGKEGTINEGRLSNFEGSPVDEMYRRMDEIGGPLSHNNYPWGWTMAGNTPFKRWKREVHEGGVADPCIVRAPVGRRAGAGGGLRRQYAHAIDILPTVLELVGVDPPAELGGIEQSHLDGTSFAHTLGAEGENEPDRHRTQHFEMLGSRAIYHDGWKAVAYHPVGPLYDDGLRSNAPWQDDVWELYHVTEDV